MELLAVPSVRMEHLLKSRTENGTFELGHGIPRTTAIMEKRQNTRALQQSL